MGQPDHRVNLIIDIQSKLQGKGPGYERWAKVFNLKQMAAALAFLQENKMREVTAAKANIDYLLGYAEPGRKKEQER